MVQVAANSKDHSTLVTAVRAGELVDALSNAGPFTVFATTNESFNKLPAGTVDNLLKPESKETLVYSMWMLALKLLHPFQHQME